jgi:hypothetical protein
MLSPIYVQKLQDSQFMSSEIFSHSSQRDSYRKATANTIQVRWWTQVSHRALHKYFSHYLQTFW